MQTLE